MATRATTKRKGMAATGVNHWLLAIAAKLQRGRSEKVPPGWQTSEQLAEEIGLSIQSTRRILAAASDRGDIECKTFNLFLGNCVRPVKHWKRPLGGA